MAPLLEIRRQAKGSQRISGIRGMEAYNHHSLELDVNRMFDQYLYKVSYFSLERLLIVTLSSFSPLFVL